MWIKDTSGDLVNLDRMNTVEGDVEEIEVGLFRAQVIADGYACCRILFEENFQTDTEANDAVDAHLAHYADLLQAR